MSKIICVSKDFTKTPGARYKTEGPFSGEEFREKYLVPAYEKAEQENETIIVDLDGGYGYPTSFLEEAFGGLARIYSPKDVLKRIEIISEDEPALVDEIKAYIADAKRGDKK